MTAVARQPRIGALGQFAGAAQVVDQRTHDHEHRDALGAQVGEHLAGAGRLSAEGSVDHLEGIEVRGVADGVHDGVAAERALAPQQRELLDLLLGREEIALDALRKCIDRIPVKL